MKVMETISISPGQSSLAARQTTRASEQAILVLGLPRSGPPLRPPTITPPGFDFAPAPLPATAANETGFWEHRQVVAIHDGIYNIFGHHWKSVSALAPQWWEDPRIHSY